MDPSFQHVQMAAEGKIQFNFIDITSVTVQRLAGKAGFEQGEALSRTPPPTTPFLKYNAGKWGGRGF